MRILVAGDWHSALHEEVAAQAFVRLGNEVERFSWHQYFKPKALSPLLRTLELFWLKLQNKFIAGPRISAINADFTATVIRVRPAAVFIYRGTHIKSKTLREIKRMAPSVVFVGYNNDDPFGENHPWWLWRHFLHAIPEYDLMYAYRHANLSRYKFAGAQRCELLRSWYIPWQHSPTKLGEDDSAEFASDVVFVGHYENDGRLELMAELVRRGVKLKLFGPGYDWDPVLQHSSELKHLSPIRLVWDLDYNKALCGAKMALCFLSKLNSDTYTRRCFEIPATGTLLLSEYSDDLAGMFKEGIEADFFRTREELVEKVRYYLQNEDARTKVARAGYERVIKDRHDVVSRMEMVVENVLSMQNKGIVTQA